MAKKKATFSLTPGTLSYLARVSARADAKKSHLVEKGLLYVLKKLDRDFKSVDEILEGALGPLDAPAPVQSKPPIRLVENKAHPEASGGLSGQAMAAEGEGAG